MKTQRNILKELAENGPDWLVDSIVHFSNAFCQVDKEGGCQSGQVGLSDKTIYFQIYDTPGSIDNLQTQLRNTVMVTAKNQEKDPGLNILALKSITEFTGVVLIADGIPDSHNEILNVDDVSFPAIVPVNVDFRQDIPPVGMATLTHQGKEVKYNISLYEGINPEDLFNLRPCFGCSVEGVDLSSNVSVVKEATQIGLSEKNADPRIKTLGESFVKNN